MLPKANDQNNRKADDRQNTCDGEVAGEGKGMNARNHAQGHKAKQVRKQDKHEKAKDIRHIFAPLFADIRL